MKKIEKTQEIVNLANDSFNKNSFFKPLNGAQRLQIIAKASVFEHYEKDEYIVHQFDASDFLFVIIKGKISIKILAGAEEIEVAQLGVSQMVGEIAVITGEQRTASCVALEDVIILKMAKVVFQKVLATIPEASLSMMQLLCQRLKNTIKPFAGKNMNANAEIPPTEVLRLIPLEFMQRHRVIPVKKTDETLLVGYCDKMDDTLKNKINSFVPALKIETDFMEMAFFDKVMQSYSGESISETTEGSGVKHIDDLLKRLVQEGGSDLHLSAKQRPHWRIDGAIKEIAGINPLGENEVFDLLKPTMSKKNIENFEATGDEDFAYTMNEVSRFRINILRDYRGVSAVFRHISNTIFSLKDLGMPELFRSWLDAPKGLILVTGPTGSGKSTTLAAMIDYINTNKESHILTIEDPVEFIHQSKKSLVNQRQVNLHTDSFPKALRAALREDPDVVLVGEMRDYETVAMALETANTGHLVLATLHTASAVSTISRVVDMFPAEMHVETVVLMSRKA